MLKYILIGIITVILAILAVSVIKTQFDKSRESSLPITSKTGAIYWAKNNTEIQEIIRKISDSPKRYDKSERDTATLSEKISGKFYGDTIEESSKHWYVTLIYCNAAWDDNRCGCQGDFASITTRINQDTGNVVISKDIPSRKIIDFKEGRTSVCN